MFAIVLSRLYKFSLAVAGSVIISASYSCKPEPPTPTPEPSLEQKLQTAANNTVINTGVPSLVISVKKESELPVTVVANHPQSPVWAGKNSLYRVGSITKTYVAALLLKLQESQPGLLDNTAYGTSTVRMLLSHTAGMGDFLSNPAAVAPVFAGNQSSLVAVNPFKVWGYNDLFSLTTFSAPGFHQYSNTGYLLAGRVAEVHGGEGFDPAATPRLNSLLHNRLLSSLNVPNTVYQEEMALPAGMINGIDLTPFGLQDVTQVHPSLFNSAGAICANAADLHTFLHALFGGKLISQASLNQMLTGVPTQSPGVFAGLGVFMDVKPRVGRRWYHNGSMPGYRTVYCYYPDKKTSVVVFTNTNINPSAQTAVNAWLEAEKLL